MTEDEAIQDIIFRARMSAWYWITQVPSDISIENRVTGAIFSFLSALDGCNGDEGPCDIVLLETDYDTGDVTGETRVSTMLHEYFHKENWDGTQYPAQLEE